MPATHQRAILAAIAEDAIGGIAGVPIGSIKAVGNALWPLRLRGGYYYQGDDTRFVVNYYRALSDRMVRVHSASGPQVTPQLLLVDATRAALAPNAVKLKPGSVPFGLDDQLLALTQQTFASYRRYLALTRRRYFNGSLLRLSRVEARGASIVLHTQPVYYEAVCRSHMCIDARRSPDAQTVREIVHPDGSYSPTAASRLADPIGVGCLLFTADGQLAVLRRSSRVVVRPDQLAPSYSGDLQFEDLPDASTDLRSIRLLREGSEELHIHPEDIEPGSFRVLAITRELCRGGKPEVYCHATVRLSAGELKQRLSQAKDRWESRGILFWDFGFAPRPGIADMPLALKLLRCYEKFITAYGTEISVPLLTLLNLWLRSMVPDALLATFTARDPGVRRLER